MSIRKQSFSLPCLTPKPNDKETYVWKRPHFSLAWATYAWPVSGPNISSEPKSSVCNAGCRIKRVACFAWCGSSCCNHWKRLNERDELGARWEGNDGFGIGPLMTMPKGTGGWIGRVLLAGEEFNGSGWSMMKPMAWELQENTSHFQGIFPRTFHQLEFSFRKTRKYL